MKMKVKQITIKHPELGEISINGSIEESIQDKIGDVTNDYSNELLFYHAEIQENNNQIFSIKNLNVIKPESINVGWMENKKGHKNFITIITNRKISEDINIYPLAVLSVIYN